MQQVVYQFHLLSDVVQSGLTGCAVCLVPQWSCLNLASPSVNLLGSSFPVPYFSFLAYFIVLMNILE